MKNLFSILLSVMICCSFVLSGCSDNEPAMLQREDKSVEQVGQAPDVFDRIVSENAFDDVVAFGGRLLRVERGAVDKQAHTATHKVEMLDLYSSVLAEYSFTCRDAHNITTLTSTADGGFLFVIGFEDYAYGQDDWASDYGVVSTVVKCDSSGQPQFETPFDGVEGSALKFCFEKNGQFYLFGTVQDPEKKTRGVYSSTDLFMTVLDHQGKILKTQCIAGSDFDNLDNAELTDQGFILSVQSQSDDGDFSGSNSGGYGVDWVITVNDQLEITEKKKETGRDYFDNRIGIKDNIPVYKHDPLFQDFDAGSPKVFIDYGEFYLIVSENVTGEYENTPSMVSAIWYYTETVYSGYDQNGKLLFRKSVDSSPDYDQFVEEYWG